MRIARRRRARSATRRARAARAAPISSRPSAQRLQHVALHRPAHERLAPQELPVDPRAVPRQRVALVPAPLLRPQLRAWRASSRVHRSDPAHASCAARMPVARSERRRRPRPSARRLRSAASCARAGAGSSSAQEVRRCTEPGVATTCSGVPVAITRPPSSPPSGPMSISRSAVLMTSRLCSITTTELPGVDQPLQHLEQPLDVGEVQPGRRLVEDVERPARRDLAQLGRELHALRLAAGQRRRRLAEPHVVEPDVVQRLDAPADLRDVLEELERLLDRHLQHVGDRSCP